MAQAFESIPLSYIHRALNDRLTLSTAHVRAQRAHGYPLMVEYYQGQVDLLRDLLQWFASPPEPEA